jgi:hypothetical protein
MQHRLLLTVFFNVSLFAQQAQQEAKPLACYSKKEAPKVFWGFWNPKPSTKPVTVTIQFNRPEGTLTDLDCVGEPLELTVPNGQQVTLNTYYDQNECSTSATTVSITRASMEIPVADILALAVKVGVFGLDAAGRSYELPPQTNKILSIDATCNVGAGRKSTQNVKITYQNPSRVAVSGGLVVSHGVRSYGVNTSQNGMGAGGVVTTLNTVAVTGSPAGQVIPFGLVNIYCSGSRVLNFNAQLGIGVNPNLSSAKVEYFASPFALGWHDLYISPGFHIGQHEDISGGFGVGQNTPSGLKVPLKWQYYTGFGVSISYNLKPLVKSGSSK